MRDLKGDPGQIMIIALLLLNSTTLYNRPLDNIQEFYRRGWDRGPVEVNNERSEI